MTFRGNYVFGLTGKKGSGKDTVAKILQMKLGSGKTVIIAFADPIRQAIGAMTGWDFDVLRFNEEFKESDNNFLGVSPRYLMQTLGTEWGRNLIHENIWLTIANQRIQKALSNGIENIIITDVRFDNECQMLYDGYDADFIEVRNPNENGKKMDNHASEQGVNHAYIDYVIENDKTDPGSLIKIEKLLDTIIQQSGK